MNRLHGEATAAPLLCWVPRLAVGKAIPGPAGPRELTEPEHLRGFPIAFGGQIIPTRGRDSFIAFRQIETSTSPIDAATRTCSSSGVCVCLLPWGAHGVLLGAEGPHYLRRPGRESLTLQGSHLGASLSLSLQIVGSPQAVQGLDGSDDSCFQRW